MFDFLTAPWPWYVAGPLIGLMVPLLLLIGNKSLGISSSMRHICAACAPGSIPFFQYEWRSHLWSLFFVVGIAAGGVLGGILLANPDPIALNPEISLELMVQGVPPSGGLLPEAIFSWEMLGTPRGLIMIVLGGFMVGFGTRWAGGCTSGHSIMGMANLQWPSLVATVCFFAGGLLMTHFMLPLILELVLILLP